MMTIPVPFRLLGPVSVVGERGPAELSGPRQRTLLALLAFNAGEVVGAERLVDALWGDRPPRTAIRSLHSHVSRIRLALARCGLPDVLLTRDPGYVLRVAPERVDARLFEEAVRRARTDLRAGAPHRAAQDLRTGLSLWSGDAMADAEPQGWAAAEVDRLNELRVAAHEDLADACLRLGQHAEALADLDRLLVSHPGRERMTGLGMMALQRAGRSAEALERYESLRVYLAEQLGADPSRWLSELHIAILRGDGSAGTDQAAPTPVLTGRLSRSVPAELPPPVGHFVGRHTELDTLELWRTGSEQVQIAVICGSPGLGKTALATEWAHRLKAHYPDGQLFCDLRGHDPDTALTAAGVLDHALRGLGVPADRVPFSATEQRDMYRSVTHDRRILILLDDAATVDHVLPLVPPTSSSLLLVTSRNRLAGLHSYHAVHTITVDALDRSEAKGLLESLLGVDRVAAEPTAVAQLAQRCGRVPLAIRIAAARLAARPRLTVASLAAELDGADGLDALTVDGDSRNVRSVFAGAYQALSEPAALLFSRLGLLPGASFTPHLAAAAAGLSVGRARRGVGELATAHLLDEMDVDRYRFHDLIRLYAAERARADDGPGQRDLAVERILDWTLTVVTAANGVLDPSRDRVRPVPRHPPDEVPFAREHKAILSFLDGERANVIATVEYAARNGYPTHAWQTSYLIAGYFESRGHGGDRIRVFQAGLSAARLAGDRTAEALMNNGLGIAFIGVHRYEEAIDQLERALALMVDADDRRGVGHAYNNIGVALMRLHRYPDAIASCKRALAVHTANAHNYGTILALINLGGQYALIGEFGRALDHLARGLAVAQKESDLRLEAAVAHTTAEAYRLMGADLDALAFFERALDVRRQAGIRQYVATTLVDIAMVHLRAGQLSRARDRLGEALGIAQELADPNLEALALAHLGEADVAAGEFGPADERLRLALALRAGVPDAAEEANVRRLLDELDGARGHH